MEIYRYPQKLSLEKIRVDVNKKHSRNAVETLRFFYDSHNFRLKWSINEKNFCDFEILIFDAFRNKFIFWMRVEGEKLFYH